MKRLLFTLYNIFLILSLILLLSSSCCYSQKRIYFNPDSTKYVEVSSYYANTDVNGNPESTKWLIYQQLSPASYLISSDTTHIQIIQPGIYSISSTTTDTFSYTYFSVVAVDSADNHSSSHLSTHPSAAFGGWILVPDRSIPISPDTLKVFF